MKYLFFLGHPAHFHLFKNIIAELNKKGHQTKVLIKSKDILEKLCIDNSLPYKNILPKDRGDSLFSIGISFLKKYNGIGKVIKQFNPDILLGSEPTLTHLGKLFKTPSFVFSEDDVDVIPQFAKIAYPFVDVIVSPLSCDAGQWTEKKIGYDGFHKLAYLHPSVFEPNRDLIKFIGNSPYFIIRLTNLNAYHDEGRSGISKKLLRNIINILEIKGNVYITSEKQLPDEFDKYILRIEPSLIHHILYYAKMYIGDSQSMAVEASLLGTPNIRFNDFAAEIGVLNELENTYKLTKGIKTDHPDLLLREIEVMLATPNLVNETKRLAKEMIKDKINVPEFFVWFIENYPESKQIMQKNTDYQYKFK